MMGAFAGQTALVTGASRGIGRAIALALAAEGAGTYLLGRDSEALDEVARRAGAGLPRPVVLRADLTSDEEVRSAVDRFGRDPARLDILVHSHGSYLRGPVASAAVEDLDRLYRANVRSVYVLTQSLLPLLKAGRGQIVFVNSSIVGPAQAELGQYAATKHALKALADSLRQEVNPDGVRVLTVYPGRTATPGQAAIHDLEGKPYRPERLSQPEDVAFMVVSCLKVPRTTEVTDLHLRPMMKPA